MARHCAAVFLALLLCSCATTSVPYRELTVRDEQLADSALLALRVVIETTDERFAAARGSPFTFAHPVLHFLLEEGDGYRTLDIPLSMTAKDWQSTDGRYRYTRNVLAKVPLGAYLLRVFELYLGDDLRLHHLDNLLSVCGTRASGSPCPSRAHMPWVPCSWTSTRSKAHGWAT